MIESDAPQYGGVKHSQKDAYHRLPANEASNRIIDLSPKRSNFIAVLGGDPSVDGSYHVIPVDGDVDRHDWGYDQKRDEREQRVSPRPERAQSVIKPTAASATDNLGRGLIEGELMPNDLAYPRTVCICREGLNAREISRKGSNECGNLANQSRQHDEGEG